MGSRAGLVASLQANELPNPVVDVSVVDNSSFRTYEVAAARTLQVCTLILTLTSTPTTTLPLILTLTLTLSSIPCRGTVMEVFEAANGSGSAETLEERWVLCGASPATGAADIELGLVRRLQPCWWSTRNHPYEPHIMLCDVRARCCEGSG